MHRTVARIPRLVIVTARWCRSRRARSSTSTAPRKQGVVDRGRVRTDTAPPRAASHHRDASRFHQRNAGSTSRTPTTARRAVAKDPDRSARRFRAEIQRRCSVEVAVIITTRSVGVARRCHRRGDRFGRRETDTGSSRTNDATGRSSKSPRSRSPTRSPARPIWCSARPKRHRSRSFAVSTTRTSVTVRSKKTLSVARTKTLSLTTPARRTSPTVLRPRHVHIRAHDARRAQLGVAPDHRTGSDDGRAYDAVTLHDGPGKSTASSRTT